jgi:hypothetical protein
MVGALGKHIAERMAGTSGRAPSPASACARTKAFGLRCGFRHPMMAFNDRR